MPKCIVTLSDKVYLQEIELLCDEAHVPKAVEDILKNFEDRKEQGWTIKIVPTYMEYFKGS